MTSSLSSSSSQFLVQLDPAHPKAQLPTRGSAAAAGYDLYSSEVATLPPRGGRKVIQTGIRICVPEGTYGRVAPRSGLAVKHGIDTGAGVIDRDYRGLVGVVLFNFGEEPFEIKAGDRIAQLILERIVNPEITHVQSLDETERGQGGFGHTGGFGGNAVSTAGNIAGNVAATAAGSLGQVAGFVGGAANDVADAVKPKQ